MPDLSHTYTAFVGDHCLASGSLAQVAVAVRHAKSDTPVLIFSDRTGKALDLDTRGSDAEISDRYSPPPAAPRGRGRPRLGVVAREVTLLPRHWDWLNAQTGGASVTLRKLVDGARRAGGDRHLVKQAHEAAYTFMHAVAGNLQNFEEATRALFANDRARFAQLVAKWPPDVREHATALAFTLAGSGE
jgi:hypothetical protein